MILLLLILLLMPTSLLAATVYIDPTCSNNGDGTAGSPCASGAGTAGPRNTWVGVTWTAGNTYKGQGGTTASLTNFLVAGSGTAGNPITLTSYGTGQHTLQGTGSYAIASINRSYLTFDNLTIKSDTSFGIYFSINSTANHLIVQNCTITSTVGNGVQVGDSAAGTDIDNVTITGNAFSSIGNAGISYASLHASSSANFDSHTITNNTFTAMGTASTNSAINIQAAGGTTATMTNLTITGNSISNTNLTDTTPAIAIRVIRSPTGSGIENIFSTVTISNNTITTTRFGGIMLSSAAAPATIGNNHIYNVDGNAGIAVFNSNGVHVEYNHLHDIRPVTESSFIDGMGIDMEFNTATIVRGNYSHDNLGHASHENSGQGIYQVGATYSYVTSNLLVGNKQGMQLDGGGETNPNYIYNNTILNSTANGFYVNHSATQVNLLTNNLVSGNALYGINDFGGSDQTLTTNLFYNNTSGNYTSITPGVTDLTSNPLLVNTYALAAGSPAYHAGTAWSGCLSSTGGACQSPPNIGAYQASSGNPSAARSAITQPRLQRH